MSGWGSVFGKLFDWVPGRKESKLTKIDKLLRENAQLQKETPLSAKTAERIIRNADTIKRLRSEIARIN